MDTNRIEQFINTKRAYDSMDFKKEFIIPTRSQNKLRKLLKENDLLKDVTLVPYKLDKGFNCSRALNIGVSKAKYGSIIITSPEVLPKGDVLGQLSNHIGENIVCRVWDTDEDNEVTISLVHQGFRDDTPGMYFLAMFNKDDIIKINGWDEEFTKGYAYEDNDFGSRWVRAGLPFTIREDIQGVHQYHERSETIDDGLSKNLETYQKNNLNEVICCEKGINMYR